MNLHIKKFKHEETEEKIKDMKAIGINIPDFVEWSILNFNIDIYLKLMQCKKL